MKKTLVVDGLLNVGYAKTVDFKTKLDRLTQANILTVVWITEELADQTWQIFRQFNTDKQWSFTDCSSYVVMNNQSITNVFTFDHHFAQMGFTMKGQTN